MVGVRWLYLLPWASVACGQAPAGEVDGLPLLAFEDFSSGASDWEFTDAAVWHVVERDGDPCLEQFAASGYHPPFKSVRSLAFVDALVVGDFVLEFRVQSTGEDRAHRDVSVAWGWQDPGHYYYAHISRDADEIGHHIYIVNGADRRPITTSRNDGVKWDDRWHTIRVVRRQSALRRRLAQRESLPLTETEFEVFYDRTDEPVLRAFDDRFGEGRLGIGSRDDTLRIDDVTVWGYPRGPSEQ